MASLETYNNNEKVKTEAVRLTQKMELDFTRFENELKHIRNKGFCTTRDYYMVESKYESFTRMDGLCNWNGFYFLKRSLFGPQQ